MTNLQFRTIWKCLDFVHSESVSSEFVNVEWHSACCLVCFVSIYPLFTPFLHFLFLYHSYCGAVPEPSKICTKWPSKLKADWTQREHFLQIMWMHWSFGDRLISIDHGLDPMEWGHGVTLYIEESLSFLSLSIYLQYVFLVISCIIFFLLTFPGVFCLNLSFDLIRLLTSA